MVHITNNPPTWDYIFWAILNAFQTYGRQIQRTQHTYQDIICHAALFWYKQRQHALVHVVLNRWHLCSNLFPVICGDDKPPQCHPPICGDDQTPQCHPHICKNMFLLCKLLQPPFSNLLQSDVFDFMGMYGVFITRTDLSVSMKIWYPLTAVQQLYHMAIW